MTTRAQALQRLYQSPIADACEGTSEGLFLQASTADLPEGSLCQDRLVVRSPILWPFKSWVSAFFLIYPNWGIYLFQNLLGSSMFRIRYQAILALVWDVNELLAGSGSGSHQTQKSNKLQR